MAKVSAIQKNKKKLKKALYFKDIRKKLKAKVINPDLSELEQKQAGEDLQKLPKNSSLCRVTRRCNITGRPRGNLRRFGLSRLMLRKLAHEGKIPGLIKSSW